MVGHTQPDRLARRMRQTARYFLRRFENQRVRAWRCVLQQAIAAVIDLRVLPDIGQIPAHQGQQVALVDAANRADAIDRGTIVQMARECIAGVRRDRAHAAVIENLRGLAQQAHLRIDRMDRKKLRHG